MAKAVTKPAGKRATGRPHECTPKRIATIVKATRMYASYETAAGHAGVTGRALHNWLERGRLAVAAVGLDPDELPDDAHLLVEVSEERPFVRLLQGVARARADIEVQLLTDIVNQAPEDWRAAKSMLATRKPDDYSEKRQLRIEMAQELADSLQDVLEAFKSVLTPEQYAAGLAALEKSDDE